MLATNTNWSKVDTSLRLCVKRKIVVVYNIRMSSSLFPEFLKPFLWSADFSKLDKEKNKAYIIFQLLEFGNREAIHWVFESYSVKEIVEVLKSNRGFSKKSANFWSLILKIPKSEMICMTQDWQRPRVKI